jgi:hypothetical protein
MIAVAQQNPIDMLPLTRHPQSRDLIRDRGFRDWTGGFADHRGGTLRALNPISRIIPVIVAEKSQPADGE